MAISSELWQQILDHLRAALPNEGCGLLACPVTESVAARVTHVFPGRNVLASPIRFRMDGEQVVAAHKFIRAHDLRLAAIFHSHPSSPPTLSLTDRREALYPDAALLVVSFASTPPAAAAWRLETCDGGDLVQAVPVVIEEA